MTRPEDMQPPQNPELSIIIVNWNTRQALQACLESVRTEIDSAGLAAETWVVDNASTDGSAALLADCYPWVQTILNDANPGYAAANNQALQKAKGNFFLLLNADTLVRPGALAALLEFMRAAPGAGTAGPRVLNPDGSLQLSCYPAPTLFREAWRLFHLDALYPLGTYAVASWNTKIPRSVDSILGACMLVRRDAVDQVGGLDEAYFMYSEEIDWCLRFRRAGWDVFWVPGAQIVHAGGQSTRQAGEAMFLQLYRSKLRYFRKHHGALQGACYKVLLALASFARLAISPLALFQRRPARQEKFELAGRYARLLRELPEF